MTTSAVERSTATLELLDVASHGEIFGGEPGEVGPDPVRRPRWRPSRLVWRRALVAALIVGVVSGAVAVHGKTAEARRAAADARVDATNATAERQRVEAELDTRLVALDAAYVEANEATAAREAQRARLVELQLAEDTLDEVVATARQDTAAVEAERDGLDDRVQQQAVDLPHLEGCLAEVRPLVDRAFLATVHPDLTVPSISPACRALIDAVSGSA